MDHTSPEPPQLRNRTRARARTRPRTSVSGVIGELLITAGVVAMLYVSWQLWIGDVIIGSQLKGDAQTRAQEWESAAPTTTAPDSAEPMTAEPPIIAEPDEAEVFGVMRIPRFGADYYFDMVGGVRSATSLTLGIGHYPGTAMPGQLGNFAVAGHRGSHGAPFQDLPSLAVGDAVVVQTPEGWYTYRFRNIEYVSPTTVDVLLPVPQVVDAAANAAYITLTTCSPRFGSSERAIAYGVFESFTPVSAGPPASLSEGTPA